MSALYLTLTTDTISQAIKDLALKADDLIQGTKSAPVNFERLIGSDAHPDISPEEQLSRLDQVRTELLRTMEDIDKHRPTSELSQHAILVLSSYDSATQRPKLDVEHCLIGPGIPCTHLQWAATKVRANMAIVMEVICHDLDTPKETFLSYFEAYEEEVGTDQFENEDDLWFISTSIEYLTALIDNPGLAWESGIEIPVILRDEVLTRYLSTAASTITLN